MSATIAPTKTETTSAATGNDCVAGTDIWLTSSTTAEVLRIAATPLPMVSPKRASRAFLVGATAQIKTLTAIAIAGMKRSSVGGAYRDAPPPDHCMTINSGARVRSDKIVAYARSENVAGITRPTMMT